jgi:hypothetical protein
VAAEPFDACSQLAPQRGGYEGAAVLVQRGRCSFLEKAKAVVTAGGAAVLVVNRCNGGCDSVDEQSKAGGEEWGCVACNSLDTMVAGDPGSSDLENTVFVTALMVRRGPGLALAALLQRERQLAESLGPTSFTSQPLIRVNIFAKAETGCVDTSADQVLLSELA